MYNSALKAGLNICELDWSHTINTKGTEAVYDTDLFTIVKFPRTQLIVRLPITIRVIKYQKIGPEDYAKRR
jgi:hypothetical protein